MQNALNNIKIMITEKKFSGRFAIVANAYAQNAPSADWAAVKELMTSTQVVNIAAAIRSLSPQDAEYEDKKNNLKKQLPCITVHACAFRDGKRKNDAAIDNGLASVDIDHLTPDEGKQLLSQLTPELCNAHGIVLVSRSISTLGVWMLCQRAENESIVTTQLRVSQLLNSLVAGIHTKVDKATKDMARLRFLTPWDYIHFVDEAVLGTAFSGAMPNLENAALQAYASSLPTEVPQGQRHTTYKDWGIQALAVAGTGTTVDEVVNTLPDLGLPVSERKSLISWEKSTIPAPVATPATTTLVEQTVAQRHKQPLDVDALPLPRQTPQVIWNLVCQLPREWRQTAALALLPSLATACGKVSYGVKKHPLTFQVAVYGVAGSGKSEFTCAPAQLVQAILGERDNEYILQIEEYERQLFAAKEKMTIKEEDCRSPQVMGFNTSTVMLAKWLKYSKNESIMLYSDEIGEAVGSAKNSNFLDLKPILRKGFDGTEHSIAYKERDSFRGKVYPRVSFLACGTPSVVFSYFDDQAAESGTARRVIFVEHKPIERLIQEYEITTEQELLLNADLQRYTSYSGRVYHTEIEAAKASYVEELFARAGDDHVEKEIVQSAAQYMLRAAYLAHVLNHYDEEKIADDIVFGRWVAEYFRRSYLNQKYAYLNKQAKKNLSYFAPKSITATDLNRQMFNELPPFFTVEDIYNWREKNNYPHNKKSLSILTRWKKNRLVHQQGKGYIK